MNISLKRREIMINGVINVYKEPGYTSFDMVARLRKIFRQKKIGHTGTLDPNASGVLPVCLGNATKVCDMLTDKDKTYVTVMQLGIATDTQDITGNIIERADVNINPSLVKSVAESFIGEYMQIPPMYSALKVNGKKLYELAREGVTVERKARPVTIYDIKIKDITLPYVTMEVSCSKGTYIRTLCDDIGRRLGCFGCVKELTRTYAAGFRIENSLKLDEIEKLVVTGDIKKHIVELPCLFDDCGMIVLKPFADRLAYNGNKIVQSDIDYINTVENKDYRLYASTKTFVGIYKKFDGEYKPVKMFL